MPSALLDARSTGSTPNLFRQMLPTLEDLQRDPFFETELLLLEAITRRRWSDSLRSGYRPASFERFRSEVLRELLLASIRNRMEDRRWRANYKLVRQATRSPVRVAIRGTDFMPVLCLVVQRDRNGGWRHVQVLVQEGLNYAASGAQIDELQVVTAANVKQLKAIAGELGLTIEPRVYWPSSEFKRIGLLEGGSAVVAAHHSARQLVGKASEGGCL